MASCGVAAGVPVDITAASAALGAATAMLSYHHARLRMAWPRPGRVRPAHVRPPRFFITSCARVKIMLALIVVVACGVRQRKLRGQRCHEHLVNTRKYVMKSCGGIQFASVAVGKEGRDEMAVRWLL